MAQQVEIAGVLFNNVPYIQCPDGNGVYHRFLDTTIPSNAAAASDITQGKLAYVNGLLVTGTASGGGGGLEYETGTWTTPTDVLKTSILFSDTHSVAPFYFMVSDETEEYYSTTSSVYNICYYNFHQLFGVAYNVNNNGTYHYGYVYRRWRNSSTGITGGVITLLYPYTDSGYIYNTYPRNWVNETGITAQSSSVEYFRAGRIYKWIAVWAPTS